jgi:hypothetical protein
MITKEQAMALGYRDTIYHLQLKTADKSPMRARVNGKCQTWKGRPDEFKLPMKHGFYDCFYLTHENNRNWSVEEPVAACPAKAL